MSAQRYVVKEGDTLWDIAGERLGGPLEWPRLYTYNNRAEVVRQTGRAIVDPDLIYPNQVLLLPILPDRPGAAATPPRPAPPAPPQSPPSARRVDPPAPSLRDQLRDLTVPFLVKYHLEDLPLMVSRGPGFSATIKLTGSMTIELGRKVPVAYVTNRGLEMRYKAETDGVLSQLLSETKVTWDRRTGAIGYSSMMVAKSAVRGGPSTAIGVSVSSTTMMPVLKAQIRFPTLRGQIGTHSYLAQSVMVTIEVSPEPPDLRRVPSPVPIPHPVRVPVPSSPGPTMEEVTTWTFILGAALLVGTIAADFLTAGASIADDPITVPAALAMMGLAVVLPESPGARPIEVY